ncbi:hypothetical protein GA707_01005 [Nostocoides sp. F2B08]|uniref:hypothetical protein n=1 Tax=Nostocoides sp. F2B08 TaxID=2653936 RepID=UPI0012636308|nr:hypothetical protein [Tetrasphaera sp. F2B08]KAB7746142.1 hypothetical protein GA707_01005 [Tetrasphaera sp. F2B08]
MTRARRIALVLATSGVLALTGCGIEERIVHLQPAPTENAEVGAPLRVEAAERIAARVLTQSAEATTSEQRDAIQAGPALRLARAKAAEPGATESTAAPVVVPATPTILAMSEAQDWPRAILAATLDETTQVQSLHVLVSTGPTEQYVHFATAPMLAGTSIPSLGEITDGATFESATDEEPTDASAIMEDYAAGLAYPEPAEVTTVSHDDIFATSLLQNAKEQDDQLGDLGDLSQTHGVIDNATVSFRTADGGLVVFGQMMRTDSITLTDEAKELQVEDDRLQDLSGEDVVTDGFSAEYLENVVLVVPADAPGELIGAEEILRRAEGA